MTKKGTFKNVDYLMLTT